MGKTAIEYGDRTWNFFPGCNGPDGKPCPYCWAQNRVLPRMKCEKCRTGKPHFHPERFDEPLHVKKAARWLVCFTGDLFGPWVEPFLVAESLNIMRRCPQHTFLCLTKQPQNLAKFSPFPENTWIGVSATNSVTFKRACIELHQIQAARRYISLEPLLSWDWHDDLRDSCFDPPGTLVDYMDDNLSQVIIGQATPAKAGTAPKVEWIREIVEACGQAGVKVFLKNNLEKLDWEGQIWPLIAPETGRLRQEVPK